MGDYDDDWDEYDDFDDDFGDDDEAETFPCPECGELVYEEADACPYCGCYLHDGWSAGSDYPWWTFNGALSSWSPMWLLLAMGGVFAVLFALMMG